MYFCHVLSFASGKGSYNLDITMRELRDREICILEEQGCTAEDWNDIVVSDDFTVDSIHNVSFYGHIEIGSTMGSIEVEEGFVRRCGIRNASLRNVSIGDDCLIENIRGYISGYSIGNNCLISDIGVMTCQEGTSFGSGTTISVLNEGGKGNVVLCEELTAQVAWMMINFPVVRSLRANASLRSLRANAGLRGLRAEQFKGLSEEEFNSLRANAGLRGLRAAQFKGLSEQDNDPDGHSSLFTLHSSLPTIGSHSRIVGVKSICNAKMGEYCEIQGASRLDNCTIMSNEDACSFIGTDVVMESSIVAPGATVTDGAKVFECFVGESVHIGKGFSAEASLFFANSYMDNGEACASLCGPFSTSHHKSTLLIGGAFSFYNAGSNTNQSNHAYKMGPIHWGMLDRGAKTASGCHILWPAHIGSFSMAMGKIQSHPQVHKLPFSYVIAEGNKTYLVPGINIKTVGTWRDVNKWPKRDLRPLSSRNDIINFAFPNPYIIQNVLEGKEILKKLIAENAPEYEYNGVFIKHTSAVKGIAFYDLIINLFLFEYFTNNKSENVEENCDRWFDVCGMLSPKYEIDRILKDVKSGVISSIDELKINLQEIHNDYPHHCAAYALYLMAHNDSNNSDDPDHWIRLAESANKEWLDMVARDAEKEFEMGDVDKEQLEEFIDNLK